MAERRALTLVKPTCEEQGESNFPKKTIRERKRQDNLSAPTRSLSRISAQSSFETDAWSVWLAGLKSYQPDL
jgi:hypothetical protein